MAVSFAELCIVIGTISCLLLVIFYAARYFGIVIDMNTTRKKKYQPPACSSIAVTNPFSVEIDHARPRPNENRQNCERIKVKIHAKKECTIQCFWNVDLTKVLSSMDDSERRSREVSSLDTENIGDVLKYYSTTSGEEQMIYPTLEAGECIEFQSPTFDNLSSASKFTKLVIKVELFERMRREATFDEDIVCLCAAIETKPSSINLEIKSFISHQFIQTAAKKLYPLKTLYSSGVPNTHPEMDLTTQYCGEDLCVICHSMPVTRALLPCRHSCICGVCFKRTTLCPICRNTIVSYLITGDESRLPVPPKEEEEIMEETSDHLRGMSIGQLLRAIWNAG